MRGGLLAETMETELGKGTVVEREVPLAEKLGVIVGISKAVSWEDEWVEW